MSYPGLSLDAACEIDRLRRDGKKTELNIESNTVWKTGFQIDESVVTDCLTRCSDLAEQAMEERTSAAVFDGQCASVLHATLQLPVPEAGDPDFWRWFTFTQGHWGAELVDWRYGGGHGRSSLGDSPGVAREVYYGLGTMKKGMFAKLWRCAHLMYTEQAASPYDGIEYADVDLWDSHITDVDYGSVASMAQAFVKVVRDLELPRGSPNSLHVPPGYRDLAKELRRRQATIAFELFDEGEAYTYVKDVWDERESWCGR